MDSMLHNQVAIVTGGNAGIGKAIALKYAQQGAKIAIFGTNSERGKEVVAEINQSTRATQVEFFEVDVSNAQSVEQGVKKVLEIHAKVDILVNNAGITRDHLLMKMSEEDWDQVLDTNLKSCYHTCHALIRVMMKAKKGKIINISSVVGLTGNAGQTNYAASKAGMIGFTKALAKEVATRNININCIAPGFIETRMTEVLTEEQKKGILAQIPMGRLGTPEEIACAALFLASYLSNYMTGQVVTVDGGMVM